MLRLGIPLAARASFIGSGGTQGKRTPVRRAHSQAAMAALLAPLDDERWDSFAFKAVSDHDVRQSSVNTTAEDVMGVSEGLCSNPGDNYCSFQSIEDLVKDADADKLLLTVCFPTGNTEDAPRVAPARVLTEDTWLCQDEIWSALTHSYGCVAAIDWKHSRTRSLHSLPRSLEPNQRESDVIAGLSGGEEEDEEEEDVLREQLDMHSIIVPFLNQEPLCTAEQVMEELEEMMLDSVDLEASRGSRHDSSYQERLGALSVAELNELLEETETNIQTFSQELIRELALREELDFEKEVKNSFISVLIDVQNRQKELRESMKRRRKLRTPQSRPERTRGSYLTTVIPYEKREGPPPIEDLQVLTNILQAMKEDSDKVPSLLTDYILKVLCPT